MTLRGKFAAFIAAPLLIAALAGATAATAGNDSITLRAQGENTKYLYPAGGSWNGVTIKHNVRTDGNLTPSVTTVSVAPENAGQPGWFQVSSGTGSVPSAIQNPGDILYIDSFSNNSEDNGNIVTGLHITGNIVNLPAIRQSYLTCMLPIRILRANEADAADGIWTDITQTVFGTALTPGHTGTTGADYEPFYVDCTTGSFDVTLRGNTNIDQYYVITVPAGGTFTPVSADSPLVVPRFVFQSTPLTYAPTDDPTAPAAPTPAV